MNLFRALSYKEWMKTRRLIGVMLLLMAAAVGYTYIDLTHEIRLNEAVNVWYGCLFQGTSVAPWMMYLLPLAGIALGVVQYVPEMTQKRLKLTLHLPAGETLIMASMLWYGFSVVLLLCLLLALVLAAVTRLFLPSEIVGMMLQQLLPWMGAAVAGYGFTAWVCIEPQWKQRMLCIVVSVGLLSMLFVSSYPGAYSQFGTGICWILVASFIFPFSSCIRFKYGVQ